MRCPFREFAPCILEKCPACVYETEKETVPDTKKEVKEVKEVKTINIRQSVF